MSQEWPFVITYPSGKATMGQKCPFIIAPIHIRKSYTMGQKWPLTIAISTGKVTVSQKWPFIIPISTYPYQEKLPWVKSGHSTLLSPINERKLTHNNEQVNNYFTANYSLSINPDL